MIKYNPKLWPKSRIAIVRDARRRLTDVFGNRNSNGVTPKLRRVGCALHFNVRSDADRGQLGMQKQNRGPLADLTRDALNASRTIRNSRAGQGSCHFRYQSALNKHGDPC
jgi:hypothetical protein